MSFWARFAGGLLSALVISVLEVPLWLLGWVVVPLAWRWRKWAVSPVTGRTIRVLPSWAWLWSNDEDGVLVQEAILSGRGLGTAMLWACWRNPVNNLRFVRVFSPPVYSAPVRSGGWRYFDRFAISILYSGWRTRVSFWGKTWWFQAGFKYEIAHLSDWPLEPTDWQRLGVGFGVRLLRFNPQEA